MHKKKQVTKPQGDTATADISAFWNEVSADGTMEKICRYGKFDTYHGVLGVCFSEELADSGFPYGIGAEYNGAPMAGEELDIVEIPAYTYAVFTCRGKMPDAFRETYRRICTEFFPQSNYEYGQGVELERAVSDFQRQASVRQPLKPAEQNAALLQGPPVSPGELPGDLPHRLRGGAWTR